jgi:hypothetical protein
MKVYLCGEKCCPSVTITDDCVKIGEDENTCTLTMNEWNELKTKILEKEI